MRVTHQTPTLDLCEEGQRTFWRSKAVPGLSVELSGSHAEGPVLRVATGGPVAARYVPEGTNTPMQVQATYRLTPAGELEVATMSVGYEFGVRHAVPVELFKLMEAETTALVHNVVTGAPDFAARWDAHAARINHAQRAKAAEAASKTAKARTDALANAVADVLAEHARRTGMPAPNAKQLADNPALLELVNLIPEPEAPEIDAQSGASRVRATTRRVGVDARTRLESGERLTETQFSVAATDRVLDEHPDADPVVVRAAVQATYDLAHACVYGAGFPDASA